MTGVHAMHESTTSDCIELLRHELVIILGPRLDRWIFTRSFQL